MEYSWKLVSISMTNCRRFVTWTCNEHPYHIFNRDYLKIKKKDNPVKNVTWILMEIPCHFMSQIHCSLVQIDTKFHEYSMSFIQVLFVFHAGTSMDFGQVQVMEFPGHFPRKWWDFHRIWSHFRTKPNYPQKDMRKSLSHFLQG